MKRKLLILAILQQLHAVHPHKMRAHDLATGARSMGHPDETEASLTSLLTDLQEKGLVRQEADPLDGAVKLWSRTEAGRVLLAENALA